MVPSLISRPVTATVNKSLFSVGTFLVMSATKDMATNVTMAKNCKDITALSNRLSFSFHVILSVMFMEIKDNQFTPF